MRLRLLLSYRPSTKISIIDKSSRLSGVSNIISSQGLTLLGGEPFLNTGILLPLIKRIRKELPEKDIWSWTGYTWEEMMLETPDKLELLSLIDILVDGRYDKSKRNLMLQFRGSSNQRIIDVQKSLKSGQVVIWDKLNDGKESYEQVKRE